MACGLCRAGARRGAAVRASAAAADRPGRARSVRAARPDARPRRRMARPQCSPSRLRRPKSKAWRRRPRPKRRRSRPSRSRTPRRRAAIAGRSAGLTGWRTAQAIRDGFDERSALEADRKRRAPMPPRSTAARGPMPNCWPSCCAARAIMTRRSSRGSRPAGVRTGGRAWRQCPAPHYRFESVELPGLDAAAGEEAARLREAFAVKAGDPVVAQKVIDAGVALQVELGERGFATANGRRAGHRRRP